MEPRWSAPPGKDDSGTAFRWNWQSSLANEIERRTGFETRARRPGARAARWHAHEPSDRMLATRYGLGAIDAVHHGDFGKMVAVRGNKIVSVPVSGSHREESQVDQDALDIASGILEEVGGK